MYAHADQAFAAQQFEQAINWFQRGSWLREKPGVYQQFRWAVSDILTGQPLSKTLDASTIPVHAVSGDLKINGEDLQWLRLEDPSWNSHNGERLSVYPTSDPTIGALWFQGSAVAIIQVPCSSIYRITARMRHDSLQGQSGEIQIEKDLSPSGTFSVSGDWQEFETESTLNRGFTHDRRRLFTRYR